MTSITLSRDGSHMYHDISGALRNLKIISEQLEDAIDELAENSCDDIGYI